MTREKALKLRELIEKGAAFLSDADALDGLELYPLYSVGVSYVAGTRIRYNDKLYKVNQSHTSQSDWIPDNTPALYTEVAPEGEIPVWRRPTGAHDAYNSGDRVWFPDHDGKVYESTYDGNVYSPAEYAAGWTEIN